MRTVIDNTKLIAHSGITNFHIKSLFDNNQALLWTLRFHKNQIDNQKNWDIAKKCANEYEFIFSFNNDGVADIVPISRSYFKLIEILHDNHILPEPIIQGTLTCMKKVKVACLCEAPGGFVQALNDYCRLKRIPLSPIHCITLLSNDKKVPNWKLYSVNNYSVSTGKDGTGDLYKVHNIDYFVNQVGRQSCDVVTGDGGFDFSNDFNSQETNFVLLLLCEVYTCLSIQNVGGSFVVKVFDLFHVSTLQIISLLRMFYKEIIIHKPKTSRPANSEKYIICKHFYLPHNFEAIMNQIRTDIMYRTNHIANIIAPAMLYDTFLHVYAFNQVFVNTQIAYIQKTLGLIQQNKFDKKAHLKECIDWCRSYRVPIKKHYHSFS